MLKSASLFRIGDLFSYQRIAFGESGEYHFRFLKWEKIRTNQAQFSAVLDTIVQETMPYFEKQGGPGAIAYFSVNRDKNGHWPKFDVLQEATDGEHCIKCAVPLEWASLAMKCPKCWKVY